MAPSNLSFLVAVLFTVPVAADDWPQWMGPNRDDVWAETGLVEEFPAEGLEFRWRRPIHGGFAGPAVADGRVYVTDYLRTTGDAPFVENGVAYGIDGDGIFRAVRIDTGERLWGTTKPVNGEDGDRRGPKEGATFVTKNADRFFIFGENGDLVIARLSPEDVRGGEPHETAGAGRDRAGSKNRVEPPGLRRSLRLREERSRDRVRPAGAAVMRPTDDAHRG
jgi:hypothetical protein